MFTHRPATQWLTFLTAIALFAAWLIFAATTDSLPTTAAAPLNPITDADDAPPDLPPDHPPLEAYQGGLPLPATAADVKMPGTQPETLNTPLRPPASNCASCHSNFGQPENEPYATWGGSMMAQAGRDPLFFAALAIANQDVANSGEFCIRCHSPRAFLEGQADPSGATLNANAAYRNGVDCHFCHRMVDPVYEAGNPPRDQAILAALEEPVPFPSSGMYIIDPDDERRGPWLLQAEGWFVANCTPADTCQNNNPHRGVTDGGATWPLQSSFLEESAFCGTCHNVQNPLMRGTPEDGYTLDPLGQEIDDMANAFSVERTYTEWLLSDYATVEGVLAPQFNPLVNEGVVRSCQDCHMPSVADASAGRRNPSYGLPCTQPNGQPCPNQVTHDLVPVHDLTGANTWVPQMIMNPDWRFSTDTGANPDLLNAGIERARTLLQKSATLEANRTGNTLNVRITNESGHKLPTGYAEGRQMWVQVRGYNAQCQVVFESGAYNAQTGILTQDAQLAWFGIKQGLTDEWANQVGLPAGESFHFLLNNTIELDNRIPPRGFTNSEYTAAGADVVGASYADGQYWADVDYSLPASVVRTEVSLLYQIASREYITFLRDANTTTEDGDILYDLWEQTGKAPPETLASVSSGTCGQQSLYLPIIR